MKITKKAFIDAMVNNLTTFCGNTRRLYEADEVYCAIRDLFDKSVFVEQRSCVARSRDLVFSGGSHLSFDQVGSYNFHKYEYPEGSVYVCCHNYHDDFDNTDRVNAMYYLVKHV
jgi:hypothetical protein